MELHKPFGRIPGAAHGVDWRWHIEIDPQHGPNNHGPTILVPSMPRLVREHLEWPPALPDEPQHTQIGTEHIYSGPQ